MRYIVAAVLLLFNPATGLPADPANSNVVNSDVDSGQTTFRDLLQPAFQQHCLDCHSGQEPSGDVDLAQLTDVQQLLAEPEQISTLLDVLEAKRMPPEDQPPLAQDRRAAIVDKLRGLLQQSLQLQSLNRPRTPLRRMTRFQYSNAVQDLFQLDRVVFALPERMLREHDNYFQPQTGRMPQTVKVGSRPLGKSQLIEPCLEGVTAFPQDLRAEHGFDTQADHLSLSPLLLESFLKLGQSIVASADFNPQTCGIWSEFFAAPADADPVDLQTVIRTRLEAFLSRAFRRPVEAEVLDRYVRHVQARLQTGDSFTDSLKSAAAAAIASPRFFCLYQQTETQDSADSSGLDDYDLATRLSFFLWGSLPDTELLQLASEHRLRQPEVLVDQVDRMLADRRLKRFCDSFPAQWLQLDRIISAIPDPGQFPEFYFAKYRASMHMMLEPLLLFETVLIEDRPILQLIDSDFSYRSDLLQSWYQDGKQRNAGSPVVLTFHRVPVTDPRQGGVITTAAVMTMTSGPTQTKPITRGAWVASVILNDPPPPPPADVPPLAEAPENEAQNLTLRQRFAEHRSSAACASCHRQIDPLGFALENYDPAGVWRDQYQNGLPVDPAGTLFGHHEFTDIASFKQVLLTERERFTKAVAEHLLTYACGREISVHDAAAVLEIVANTAEADYRSHALLKQIVLSEPFQR